MPTPATLDTIPDKLSKFRRIRQDSLDLCTPLQIEDYVVQTAAEASPPKWHLAHTTWFFETFLLDEFLPGYRPFHPQYRYLFNSYYEQIGDGLFPRANRGMLSRPTVNEVVAYRQHVDEHMQSLLADTAVTDKAAAEIQKRLLIGLHHEQQHQELLLTDIKYNLGYNPLRPAYRSDLSPTTGNMAAAQHWIEFEGGLREIGHDGDSFAWDNESPRHTVLAAPFRLSSRLITNSEFLEFIAAGGYQTPGLWLADGWKVSQEQAWQAPLYWEQRDGQWWIYTLGGLRPLSAHEPVCHVSYYEADAYASWAGKRLPSEAEWEVAAIDLPLDGNLRSQGLLHPAPASDTPGLAQMIGDVWEWTASAYQPYPGYQADSGALGEYNGKFMCNQMVLRGGSCVTPPDHLRTTYRNFFYAHERWQFKGFRLAEGI